MSAYGDILDAILVHVATAIPTVTTAREFTPQAEINDYPFAYAYMAQQQATELDWLQESQQHFPTLVLWTNGETQEAMYLKVDAIRSALYGDRTLGGLLERLFITQVDLFESAKTGTTKGAEIVIASTRERGEG